MRVPAIQTIILKPELIRLVRRGDSRKWQAHYKLEHVKTGIVKLTSSSRLESSP